MTREYRGARFEEMDLDAILARAPKVVLDRRAGPHQRARRAPTRSAGRTSSRSARRRHRRHHDRQHPAPRVGQRRRREDHRHHPAGDGARRGRAPGRADRARRHHPRGAAPPDGPRQHLQGRQDRRVAVELLPRGQPRPCASWPCCGSPTGSRTRCASTRTTTTSAQTWETRERLIVGVTGTDTDEALLRRAARIASRTGAEIFAVHVVSTDAVRTSADTTIARDLVREFEGRFEEVVEDDVATALVSFARTERGTQIVLGASRPRAPWRPPSGVVEKVLRHARDLDVHIIAVGGERPVHVHPRRVKQRVSWYRRSLALVAGVVALPADHAGDDRDPHERVAVDHLPRLPARRAGPRGVGRRRRRGRRGARGVGARELLLRHAAPHARGGAPRRRGGPGGVPGLRGGRERPRRPVHPAQRRGRARPRRGPDPGPGRRQRGDLPRGPRLAARLDARGLQRHRRGRARPSAPRAGPSTWRAASPSTDS